MSIEPVIAALAALSTSCLSDALDRLGVAGQCADIKPLDRSFALAGRAFTVRYGPVGEDTGTVGDYIDDLGPGNVVVLDNQGRTDATVWGDLLTITAAGGRIAGTVIDGVCRDVARALSYSYPVFSRGNLDADGQGPGPGRGHRRPGGDRRRPGGAG